MYKNDRNKGYSVAFSLPRNSRDEEPPIRSIDLRERYSSVLPFGARRRVVAIQDKSVSS